MVDRKHSLHILGNLIAAVNITYCVPTWGQGERERERERGGGERERERDRESGREGGRERHRYKKNTSKVLATSQLQVYARDFQLVLSPAWRARPVFSFNVSCFNIGSSSDVHW